MKTLLVAVAVVLFAGWAFADGPSEMRLGEQVPVPALDYEFYCQPVDPNLYTVNASSAFDAWVVDDIPDEFTGMNIVDIVFYVGEWLEYWVDPSGVYVDFYYSECPPGLVPDESHYFAWSDLITEVIYDVPGSYTWVRCKGYFLAPVTIQEDMSIAFQVVTPWGDVAPYSGIAMAEPVPFGDCAAYRDGPAWGYPRWTVATDNGGIARDVAYCLSDGAGGDPSMTFLTCLSDCDETMYKFNITAGGAPVNDMELCIYDADTGEPVDIELCSVPLDWSCGHNGGPHCAYYQTTEHTLAPGETHGPFDFVTSGGVHQILEVIWTFTYNGNVVAGPETTYFMCGASGTEPKSWGAVKALYK
jgi:hypothetical protein